MIVGSTLGGCAPLLWHGSTFSVTSVLLGVVGGIAGIWLAYRFERG